MQTEIDGTTESQGVMPESTDMETDPTLSRFDDMDEKYGMLNDGMAEIRNLMSQLVQNSAPKAAAPVEEEIFDDDEPLTGSKVSKIVSRAVNNAVAKTESNNVRKSWDDKTKEDFPINDPKFSNTLNKVWKELVDGGLNPNGAKSLYTAAKITADRIGAKVTKPAAARSSEETVHTSEAPTGVTRTVTSSRKVSMVDETDTRVRFYKMKGDKTNEQITALRVKLAEKDARKVRR